MLFYLIILFTVVPVIELMLLVRIGARIGLLPTVALVLVTGMVGAALARFEGWRTLRQIQEELSLGQMPGEALVQGAMIVVAGALLMAPGVLTDVFGLAILVPPLRHYCARYLIAYLKRRVHITYVGTRGPEHRRHVDAKVTDVDEDADG